jgi:hypothetical protein
MPNRITTPASRHVIALIGRAILGTVLLLAAFPIFAFAVDQGSSYLGQPLYIGAYMILAGATAFPFMFGPYFLVTALTSLFSKRSSDQSNTVEETA